MVDPREANNCKPGTLVKLRTGEIGRVRQILAVLDFHPLGTKVNLDDEKRHKMGRYGRKKMEIEFDQKIVVQKYLETISRKLMG